jgi:ribosome maturation factor RimP
MVEQVKKLVLPVVDAASLELVEVRFLVDRGRRVLRLYIDKPGGVTLQDCSSVSKEVSRLLDVHEVLPHRYTLEVSSPGLDRPLREPSDFRRNLGRLIQVTARRPSSGTRTLVGILFSWDQEGITLKVDGREESIRYGDIVKARLKPKY